MSNSRVRDLADNNIVFVDGISTLDITESNNLFFTNARADARISLKMIDEDNMSSNSSAHMPTQQSVKSYVDTEVSGLVDTAPGTLDTLNELAAALGDDANFSTTVTNSIAAKLPLAGGTMTGDLTVEKSAPYINISNSAENIGGIKMYDNGGAATQYFNLTYDSGASNTVGFDTGASGEYTFSVNTDEKMRIDSSGNVGIGTSTPDTILEIVSSNPILTLRDTGTGFNNGDATLRLAESGVGDTLGGYFDVRLDASMLKFDFTPEGGSASTYMAINSSDGNVGIGTTSPGDANEGAGLRVHRYVDRAQYYSPAGSYAGSFGYTNNTNTKTWLSVDSGYNQTSSVSAALFLSPFHSDANGSFAGHTIKSIRDGGALLFSRVNTATSTGTAATESEFMRISGSGNVGIGSDNPGAKLKIDGPSGIVQLSGGSTGSSIIYGNAASNHTGELIQLIDKNGAQQLVMTNAGKLGIGTSSAVEKLHVSNGNFRIDTDTNSTLNIKDAGTNAIAIYAASSDELYVGANDTYKLRFKTDGNIVMDNGGSLGIGVASPADKLDVQGADNGITIRSVTANRPVLSLINGSSTMLKISANGTYGAIGDGSDANRYMSFKGANVGIGTVTPAAKLDVNGRLRVAAATPFANLNQIGYQAAIYAGETQTGTGSARYIPLIAHTSTSSSGYRQHTVFGSRRGGVWGSAFIGVGGNDAYPTNSFEFNYTGTFTAPSTKNFQIDHPIPEKTNTHYLVHAAIEGPQADLIYRGKINLVNGSADVDLDQAARMTSGTFILLCTNVQCFTSNESNWDLVKGSVSGSTLTIESQNANSTAEVSWMVVAERKDNGVQHFPEARLEVEPLKENESE